MTQMVLSQSEYQTIRQIVLEAKDSGSSFGAYASLELEAIQKIMREGANAREIKIVSDETVKELRGDD